jgi:hypothetical protein
MATRHCVQTRRVTFASLLCLFASSEGVEEHQAIASMTLGSLHLESDRSGAKEHGTGSEVTDKKGQLGPNVTGS